LGVGPSDYILYAENIKKAKQPQAGQGVEMPSAGMLVPACLNGHELPADVLADPALSMSSQNNGDDSRFVFNAARILFEKYEPRARLINLPETDSIGHKTGGINAPEEIRPVMTAIDAGLGELIAAYKKAGIFEKTLWVITADHGMTPNTISVDGQAISQSSSLICPRCKVNGSTQFLGRPELAMQVAEQVANAEITGVTGVYARVKKEGVYQYQAAQKTSEILDPDLNEAYLYLLSTFAGPNSPDIAIASNTNILGANDAASKGGKHSAMNWADQHIPLLFSGPGVTGGKTSTSPARLADILPTIAQLMALNSGKMDGIVLSDALISPQPTDTEAQNVINDQLTTLRNALKKTAN
jgi:phosphoglycerol transferase MdoB-like AlkP superfamily enzyme